MSQDYTPVAWVDETTSQQGTLINAERLNQMQTAHHYADGFEEVDAIPTEDPGVDYHKVVYCTADATFYRWDGEVWTADIDEETKHLLDQEIARAEHAEGLIQGYLDAHEANHNNPHQVTKAQVGLGNCDNTADTDKPISTAAQAALDTKADKATTLAGYGITDAYTKAQADTLLADKADKADVYDKTAADTLLAGKVDKLVSSPAGTYKSVTVNAQGQVTAGTNPDTLAGFGITDAYTKTEADNLLATKADTTALTDGSVTKVGTADLGTDTKPIKLVAGVPTAVTNDLVTIDTAQTITGAKQLLGAYTFKKYLVTYSGATAGYRKLWTFSGRGVFNIGTHSVVGQYRALSSARYLVEFYRSTFDSTDNKQTRIYTTANTSSEEMVVGANINPAEGEGAFAIYGYMVASSSAEFLIDTAYNEDGTFKTNFVESSDTAVYSLADIGAIVPLADPYNMGAALDGYAPMVRIANDQDITGNKTAQGQAASSSAATVPFGFIQKVTNYDVTQILSTGNRYMFGPTLLDQNGKIVMGFRVQVASSGSGRLIFTLVTTKTDGNLAFKTLGEYNQATDTWS